MTAGEWGLLLGLSLLWGGSFFFNAVAVAGLPVLTVVLGRVALGAAVLWAVLILGGQAVPRGARLWGAFLAMGFLNNVIPFSLIVWGQQHLASGTASILNASTPLFTVLLAHGLTEDEKLSPGRAAGVVVGLAGVAVMIGLDALAPAGVPVPVLASLACLGAAVSYGLAGIFGRRFQAWGVAPMATAAGQVTASSLLLLPVWLLVDRPWGLGFPGWAPLGALAAVALLSTALAYVIYFRLLGTAGASNIVLVTFLVPVSAILLGVLILGEVLLPRHLGGMALIGLGLAAIDGRPARRLGRLLRR